MSDLQTLIKVWRWRGVDWPSADSVRCADELEKALAASPSGAAPHPCKFIAEHCVYPHCQNPQHRAFDSSCSAASPTREGELRLTAFGCSVRDPVGTNAMRVTAVCPHCHLPATMPEVCTPEVNAAIEGGIAHAWEMFEAGRQHEAAHHLVAPSPSSVDHKPPLDTYAILRPSGSRRAVQAVKLGYKQDKSLIDAEIFQWVKLEDIRPSKD